MTHVGEKLERLLIDNRTPHDRDFRSIALSYYRDQLSDTILYLLLRIRDHQEKAVSYRDFNVAAGVIAVRHAGLWTPQGHYFGNNVKVDDTDLINIHAEDIAIGSVPKKFDAISVLGVIGPTQEDHASGKSTPTLHPCGRCRERYSSHPLIRPDTLVVTATPDFRTLEFSTMPGLQKLHDEGNPDGVHTVQLDDSADLFTPLHELEARRPEIVEVDDSEWQAKVGTYLLQRYAQLIAA